MLTSQMSLERRRAILARTLTGMIPYALAIALSFVSAYVTLFICGAIALYYAFPLASGTGRPA